METIAGQGKRNEKQVNLVCLGHWYGNRSMQMKMIGYAKMTQVKTTFLP